MEKLRKYIKRESTHLNWKLLFALSMITLIFICSLLRGNGKTPSVVGVLKCDAADHTILVLLIVSGFVYTIIASRWGQKEHLYKKSIGYNFVKGDIPMDIKSILKLGAIGFMAGFLNAGFGVGSAFVVSPALFLFDQNPATASATGMFIATLNCVSSSIVVILFNRLQLWYALILCIATAVGTIPGIILQHKIVAWTGRPSMTVLFLMFFILFSTFANPWISINTLV
jgi:hypothetical protein